MASNRPYSDHVDMEPFRAELDTRWFRSQVTARGAREFVRRLQYAGPGVVVWIRSERPLCACGAPLRFDEHVCPTCTDARFRALVAADRKEHAA